MVLSMPEYRAESLAFTTVRPSVATEPPSCYETPAGSLYVVDPTSGLPQSSAIGTITLTNEDGTTTDWTFTTGSATALAQRGITKVGPNALTIGEELTVTFTPARNGSPLGGLIEIERADGQVLGNEGGN